LRAARQESIQAVEVMMVTPTPFLFVGAVVVEPGDLEQVLEELTRDYAVAISYGADIVDQ
jgi:hypothetical protein